MMATRRTATTMKKRVFWAEELRMEGTGVGVGTGVGGRVGVGVGEGRACLIGAAKTAPAWAREKAAPVREVIAIDGREALFTGSDYEGGGRRLSRWRVLRLWGGDSKLLES